MAIQETKIYEAKLLMVKLFNNGVVEMVAKDDGSQIWLNDKQFQELCQILIQSGYIAKQVNQT